MGWLVAGPKSKGYKGVSSLPRNAFVDNLSIVSGRDKNHSGT